MKKDKEKISASDSRRKTTIGYIEHAAGLRKCHPCGCFHGAIESFQKSLPNAWRSAETLSSLSRASSFLMPRQYDCLGCEVCPPALALNSLMEESDGGFFGACPTDHPKTREGWPPLPGSFRILRFQSPVAVCTLNDFDLMEKLAASGEAGLSIVGTLQTENIGIERLIINITANPHLRFLILCGREAKQAVGHLAGQTLLSLVTDGLDEKNRIVGSRGKRPVIQNVERDVVEHFRKTITLVDLRGEGDQEILRSRIRDLSVLDPGPVYSLPLRQRVDHFQGYLPPRMTPDPAGYFIVYPDPARRRLFVEHYRNNGLLDAVIEGRVPSEILTVAIDRNLCSRMDHAAYLGQELARAEHCLVSGVPYIQDQAAESQEVLLGTEGILHKEAAE